jgi:CheY-like chemotaxis protein
MLLRPSGHDVYVAYTGRDAFSAAEAERPDVCIMDIGMPGMNGYEVARLIRREACGARMVLVAVTGWGQEGRQE